MKITVRLLLILALLTSISNAETKIIAHRGFSAKAPENTMAAFKKAIRIGADYFELDVHKTVDDSLLVIHDGKVDRVCSNGISGEIASMSFEDTRTVRMGYPEKFGKKFKREGIPTLKKALAYAKGKIKVCIEIKVQDVEADVLKTVNDLDMNNDVIIFSFYYDVLEKIRALDADIPILYLESTADETTIKEALAIQATAIGVSGRTDINKDYLKFVHKNGLELWCWTVNKECEMEVYLQIGIDGLITNFPNKALKIRSKIQ